MDWLIDWLLHDEFQFTIFSFKGNSKFRHWREPRTLTISALKGRKFARPFKERWRNLWRNRIRNGCVVCCTSGNSICLLTCCVRSFNDGCSAVCTRNISRVFPHSFCSFTLFNVTRDAILLDNVQSCAKERELDQKVWREGFYPVYFVLRTHTGKSASKSETAPLDEAISVLLSRVLFFSTFSFVIVRVEVLNAIMLPYWFPPPSPQFLFCTLIVILSMIIHDVLFLSGDDLLQWFDSTGSSSVRWFRDGADFGEHFIRKGAHGGPSGGQSAAGGATADVPGRYLPLSSGIARLRWERTELGEGVRENSLDVFVFSLIFSFVH